MDLIYVNLHVIFMGTTIFNYNEKVVPSPDSLEYQKKLVNTMKKARREHSKARMLYQVLHDVQAVYQGVDSYLEILMNSELKLDQCDWDMMCHEVRSKSSLVGEMVDCAIELAQYGDLGQVPRRDDVLVNMFCQDMFYTCERYLNNPNIQMCVETSLADDFIICTHLGYLRKLFKNLIVSAMQFTHEGYIKLSVMPDDSGKYLVFRLSNTGLGIPEDMQDVLFEKLPNDGNLCNTIVGVRLRISYALTQKMGGTMFLDQQCKDCTSIVFSIAI